MRRSKLTGNGLHESSRFILPEHQDALIKHYNETYGGDDMSKAKTRPTRDEFELEEIANQLSEAKGEKKEVSLDVWGTEEPVIGRVTEMNANTKRIHVERYGEVTKVPFMDIMRVSSV